MDSCWAMLTEVQEWVMRGSKSITMESDGFPQKQKVLSFLVLESGSINKTVLFESNSRLCNAINNKLADAPTPMKMKSKCTWFAMGERFFIIY